MFSEQDLKLILGEVPSDFQKEHKEFWNYIGERLRHLTPSLKDVYLILETESMDSEATNIVNFLQGEGVRIHKLEDKTLVGEARAWYLMTLDSRGIGEEFLEETNSEISDALRHLLDSSLGDMEVGVVFFEPICKIDIGDDMRVIRMSPFDPKDFLARHLIRKKIFEK